MANKAVFGIAANVTQAEHIADQLKAAGFSGDDISVLFPDKEGSRDFAHEQHTKAPEGAATGAGDGRCARRSAGLARRYRRARDSRASARSSRPDRSWPRWRERRSVRRRVA